MTGEAIAIAAERRWAIVVGFIIAAIIAIMVFTGLHWAAMPPSRVETIDPRTLHVSGEFVEANLGTRVGKDGKVVVRLIAQQYSFHPQCLLVPAGVPVTFRGTSTDVIHGFNVSGSNANAMLVPGFVATFTTTFREPGDRAMPCHEYCGTGHEGMWAHVKVVSLDEFRAQAGRGERLSCVPR
jgi:cytochrome c oxidase subunit 2